MNLSGKRILITGGAGFIGSHLVERLAGSSEIRVLDDFSTGDRANLECSPVEIMEGDVCEEETVRRACRGVDVVFHLAVSCLRTSLGHPRQSHDVNAGGALTVCEASLCAGVSRLVYVSSSEVYGTAQRTPMSEEHPLEPTTVYGAAKLAGEAYARAFHRTHGLPVIVVRPFNTYGPREPWRGRRAEVIPRFILCGLAGRSPVIFGDGEQTRDFTFVEDTTRGLILAAECDALIGGTVNIASGRETSIRRLAGWISQKLNVRKAPVFAAARPGDVKRHVADVHKAESMLGFRAEVTLDEGLDRFVAWFRSRAGQMQELCETAGSANW
jgi:UDP-glucose 4-epimerase